MSHVKNTRNAFALIAESDSEESDEEASSVEETNSPSHHSVTQPENNVAWADMDTSDDEGEWEPTEKKKRDPAAAAASVAAAVAAAVEFTEPRIETVEDANFQHVKRKGGRPSEEGKQQSKQAKLNPPEALVSPSADKKRVSAKKGISGFATLLSSESSESESESEVESIRKPAQKPKAEPEAKKKKEKESAPPIPKEAAVSPSKKKSSKKPEPEPAPVPAPAPAPIPEPISGKGKKKKPLPDEKEDFNKILSEFREVDGIKKKKKKKPTEPATKTEEPLTAKPEVAVVPKATPKQPKLEKPTEAKPVQVEKSPSSVECTDGAGSGSKKKKKK